jgi:hypothetical protein
LLWMFWRWGFCKVFLWAGLEQLLLFLASQVARIAGRSYWHPRRVILKQFKFLLEILENTQQCEKSRMPIVLYTQKLSIFIFSMLTYSDQLFLSIFNALKNLHGLILLLNVFPCHPFSIINSYWALFIDHPFIG